MGQMSWIYARGVGPTRKGVGSCIEITWVAGVPYLASIPTVFFFPIPCTQSICQFFGFPHHPLHLPSYFQTLLTPNPFFYIPLIFVKEGKGL